MHSDEYYMRLALAQASLAQSLGEVPVGAVLVDPLNDKVISTGCNRTISNHDPCAHAEILCLKEAGSVLSNYRLLNLTLYVTLEPCAMCAMALIHARVKRIVFGASDLKTGACGSVFSLIDDPRHNHHLEVTCGVLQEECSLMLSNFFKRRRAQIKEAKRLAKLSDPFKL